MSEPFSLPWHDFVSYAMLEIKNGWPLTREDEVKFLDKDGNEFTIFPSYVQITLHKKAPNDDPQSFDISPV